MMMQAQRECLSDALGLGWKGKSSSPWRNRTAHNTNNVVTATVHASLEYAGFLVRDPAQDYGRMRVYRVTEAGAAAIGKKLSKKLVALIPEAPIPNFEEAQRLAA